MAVILTGVLVAVLAGVVVWRTVAVRARRAGEEKLRIREREDRREKEEALLERVAEVRKKRQNRVADAVRDDPARAAKALRTMMRGKTGKGGGE